jgi:DNA repair protein RadC
LKHFSFANVSVKVAGAEGAKEFLDPIFLGRNVEILIAAYCDERLRISFIKVFPGTVDYVPMAVRDILSFAMESKCPGFFIGHNHPSGDSTPSELDKTFTKRLSLGAEALDIELLDHFVYGDGLPYSFRSRGLL